MASMISYFGRCEYPSEADAKKDPSILAKVWDEHLDIGGNLNKHHPDVQLKILLEQSLAAAYYLKFYGARCHDMITEFISELCADVTFRFNHQCEKSFKDAYHHIFVVLNNLVKFNRGGKWEFCCPDLICEFLYDTPRTPYIPSVWGIRYAHQKGDSRSAVKAFVTWMNGKEEAAPITSPAGIFATSFTIERISWSSMSEMRFCAANADYLMSAGFSAKRTPFDEATAAPILGFLSHFLWNGYKFEQLIGFLTNFCLHRDMEREGLSHAHRLAYCLLMGCMFPTFDVKGSNYGIEDHLLDLCRSRLFDPFLQFLNFCVKERGMTVVDRNVVARAFGAIASTKEQKDSVRYLAGVNATPSADDFNAFQKVMGTVESLQLISQNPTLITTQSDQVTAAAEDAKPEEGKQDNKSEPAKEPGKDDEAKSEKKDDQAGSEEEGGDAPDADEPGENSDGPEEGDTPAEMPDEGAGSTDDESTGSSSGDSSTSTDMQSGTPEEVHASDDKGIEIKFAPPDSETVDTVLFREEMDKFLANVLTNPPKCMSPQEVLTLLALKRYWLHSLSIETIKGIVEACVRLPKTIKNSVKATE